MVSFGRLEAVLFSRLLNRFALPDGGESTTSAQPKLLEGSSSQPWTSATSSGVLEYE
jgi:hypothetical protein